MGDYDRRQGGGGGGGGYNRKRRHRDDDYERHHQRRRHDVPVPIRVRKQLLSLAESPLRKWHEEVVGIARMVADNDDDSQLRENFVSLVCQLVVEQPLKTPFVAAVVLVMNTLKPDITVEVLRRVTATTEENIKDGKWREVKLNLKFLACLQSCLEGDGLFPVLEELFARAVDLQTASSDDTIGTELVKIILLTLPYLMAAAPGQWHQKAADLMDKTDIIASEPHSLQQLIDPYHPEAGEESPAASASVIGLLQKQLQAEAKNAWALSCIPRPWRMPLEEVEQQAKLDEAPRHPLPAIAVPETVITGPRALFPEVYFSVYSNQEIESVPPVTNIAASLVRDVLLDTINFLDFNRNVTARCLIDLDCYFADGTFVKRATPFDRLKDVEPDRSTWKPEDAAVDAVFSQLFSLPSPEHKLVYYHSVLTEACKIAPAAIAPSLGRAIRFLYKNCSRLDLELTNRFIDWFAHHLSNFGFTWKWSEWVEDAQLPKLHPRKAFIRGAIDKEIRLSFAQRIKNTLPPEYQDMIGPEKEQEMPEFKFKDDSTPFAEEGRELASLLKRKAPDEDIQPIIERIHNLAIDRSIDPLVASTDVFTTAVLHVGSKSLSHVLACIERTKDRLLDAGAASEAARAQIISSVMNYWSAHPGVATAIVGKLLNYSILSPAAVIQWALVNDAGSNRGAALADAHLYEMVFNTVVKVTSRTREVAENPSSAALPAADNGDDDIAMTSDKIEAASKAAEIKAMRELFRLLDDALVAWASGTKDEMMEAADEQASARDALVKRWGERWLRVFRRRSAIEEAFLLEVEKRKSGAASAEGGEKMEA
ncbi:uncharacterized protein E0L32_009161 [Thyridium curvatum]|uniref:Cap binding protein n=1 Tax=Thyridium curvatum TaxID=1093900 RepID=A0A507AY07_9PEZI|nr:uncharacterized protein E0L32_009161 [Thyridium curvatum]TPX09688.1 hypothetical protein E0L32_009161 [Thyridium curvatum]